MNKQGHTINHYLQTVRNTLRHKEKKMNIQKLAEECYNSNMITSECVDFCNIWR